MEMNYYSPETCKQLEQLGCVAETWYIVRNGKPEVLREENAPTGVQFMDYRHVVPAYSNADFTASSEAKDNLEKVFNRHPNGGKYHPDYWPAKMKIVAGDLLDIILSGGDGESFIKEALENI